MNYKLGMLISFFSIIEFGRRYLAMLWAIM